MSIFFALAMMAIRSHRADQLIGFAVVLAGSLCGFWRFGASVLPDSINNVCYAIVEGGALTRLLLSSLKRLLINAFAFLSVFARHFYRACSLFMPLADSVLRVRVSTK